jgi:uncharacterized protein YeaC (DUF1315 family)
MQRTGADGIGPRPFLRTAFQPAAIENGLVPDGAALHHGCHPRGQHGCASGTIAGDRETKAALLGQNSSSPALYQLMLAQESGEWAESSALAKQLKLTDDEVASTWFQALQWAQEATSGV